MDEDHVKKLKGLGITMRKLESPWVKDVKKPNKRTIQEMFKQSSHLVMMLSLYETFSLLMQSRSW